MANIKPNKKLREVDELTRDVDFWWNRSLALIRNARVRTWKGVAVLAFISGALAAVIWVVSYNIQTSSDAMRSKSPLMKAVKISGCVADGILSDYGGNAKEEAAMIKRSNCRYLHRALETWAHPPDFEKARNIMNDIKTEKPDMIFGMFLAEAVNPNAVFYYPAERRNFDFSQMCKKGSEGFWGESTCKGNFASSEYRKYLKYITERAIDAGIQSFLIGQIFFQDNGTGIRSHAKDIVGDMRKYASSRGKEIIIGAQTNDITDEKYLRLFDFIEGGIGENSKGSIENGPCFSKWWKKEGDRCWALLWHPKFSEKANDVLLHLDWSGFYDDDMSIFARMSRQERADFLEKTHNFFVKKGMGFLLPYFAVINDNNGSCYGPERNYYSASLAYSCKDETALNSILKKAMEENGAQFVSQTVPLEMIAGRKYRGEVVFKNTGDTAWTRKNNYRLGSQNPRDNNFWGGRVDLEEDETVGPGETQVFIFSVTAPKIPGVYDFQWQMLEEGQEWFGEMSGNLRINVAPRPNE